MSQLRSADESQPVQPTLNLTVHTAAQSSSKQSLQASWHLRPQPHQLLTLLRSRPPNMRLIMVVDATSGGGLGLKRFRQASCMASSKQRRYSCESSCLPRRNLQAEQGTQHDDQECGTWVMPGLLVMQGFRQGCMGDHDGRPGPTPDLRPCISVTMTIR